MEYEVQQQGVRQLLTDMLTIMDTSPDPLQRSYAAMRDLSYQLAIQVRTAALPDVETRQKAFIREATGRKW